MNGRNGYGREDRPAYGRDDRTRLVHVSLSGKEVRRWTYYGGGSDRRRSFPLSNSILSSAHPLCLVVIGNKADIMTLLPPSCITRHPHRSPIAISSTYTMRTVTDTWLADDYDRRSISPRTIPRRPTVREAAFPPPRRPPTAPARVEPNAVLGVFGLSIRTREADLEDEFARYGDVAKVVIVYDQRVGFISFISNVSLILAHQTDRSRGFGFITMRTTDDAARAIEKLNGLVLHGRAIRVDYSATQKPHQPTPGEYMGAKRPGCEFLFRSCKH